MKKKLVKKNDNHIGKTKNYDIHHEENSYNKLTDKNGKSNNKYKHPKK